MSASAFNAFIAVMVWSTVAAGFIVVTLMATLLLTCAKTSARRKRTKDLVELWRGIFAGTAVAGQAVAPDDVFVVLNLWNDFWRVRGASTNALADIARAHRFDALAIERLRHGDDGDRIVALETAGHLRLHEALPEVRMLTAHALGDVSLAAFRALAFIESSGTEEFVDAIGTHGDWPARAIERVLRTLGPQKITAPMAQAVARAPDAWAPRYLRFLSLCDPAVAHKTLIAQLNLRTESEVLSSALRALSTCVRPDDRDLLRGFLQSPVAFVRIAALAALAPITQSSDRDALVALLSDENSWVRYRAAQLLVDGCVDESDTGGLRRSVADRYARNALAQVLAERSVVEPEAPARINDFLPERRRSGLLRLRA